MSEITNKQLIELMGERYSKYSNKLQTFWEKHFQLEMADVLLDKHKKVFMEYPYPDSKDECDIVITDDADCHKSKIWIEIKPVWSDSNYWSPSKFFGEAPFKKDVLKLYNRAKQGEKGLFFFNNI